MFSAKFLIREFKKDDIPLIVKCFAQISWFKPASIFEQYFNQQTENKRRIWVAYLEDNFAGYVTLKWQSKYDQFSKNNIPEIMDLNVLPNFRNQGIGSKLLKTAEECAALKYQKIGLGVGLYRGHDGGYGAAQKLYVKKGYVPDGYGVTYQYKEIVPGESYPIDDDLILWFTKNLSQNT